MTGAWLDEMVDAGARLLLRRAIFRKSLVHVPLGTPTGRLVCIARDVNAIDEVQYLAVRWTKSAETLGTVKYDDGERELTPREADLMRAQALRVLDLMGL